MGGRTFDLATRTDNTPTPALYPLLRTLVVHPSSIFHPFVASRAPSLSPCRSPLSFGHPPPPPSARSPTDTFYLLDTEWSLVI